MASLVRLACSCTAHKHRTGLDPTIALKLCNRSQFTVKRAATAHVRFGSRLCENPIGAMILLLNRRGQ